MKCIQRIPSQKRSFQGFSEEFESVTCKSIQRIPVWTHPNSGSFVGKRVIESSHEPTWMHTNLPCFLPILKQAYLGTFDWTLEYNQVMLVAFVLVPWLKIWDFLLPEIRCWWSMSAKVLIEIPLTALLGWFNLMWAWERLNHVDTFEGFHHHSLS